MASPSETYNIMARAGLEKINSPLHLQAVQGFMAGAYVALGGLFANLMEGGLYDKSAGADHTATMPYHAVSNLVGGAVFPVGLIAIFMTGANLYVAGGAGARGAGGDGAAGGTGADDGGGAATATAAADPPAAGTRATACTSSPA